MKRVERKVMVVVMVLISFGGFAQKIDEQRMERDIEVAENILGTILKQQFSKRSMFAVNVTGIYRAGYGVTFTIPNMQTGFWLQDFDGPATIWTDGQGGNFSISYSDSNPEGVTITQRDQEGAITQVDEKPKSSIAGSIPKAPRAKKGNTKNNRDSLKEDSRVKVMKAVKEFIADYGDLVGQLSPSERIIVTNHGEERFWFNQFDNQPSKTFFSMEVLRGDLTQYKQGKLTREQLMNKIKVVNSEMDNELQPDLELLASIFSRLYRSDLSKTYFTQENTYYEHLKGYGVIYYMQVYSGNQREGDVWNMPTVSLEEVDQATRDKKVKELYPLFTKSIKEDMLEYGRTLKSLKDDESLILNIKMTRCIGCGIPSSLELSVKNSVLKDYSSGKLSKEAAVEKIVEKKGAEQ
jgi:hypothetical protein